MTRTLRIEWHPGRKVSARLTVPRDPAGAAILLAHGAGAGQAHPFLAGLRTRLAAAGHPTMTFDYPYMEEGRRAPDRPPTLLACHRAALHRLARYGWPVVMAGKSMGGRMASHLAVDEPGPIGLVFYGYPLVSLSRGTVRPTGHLTETGMRMLFLTGSRDRMAPLEELRPVVQGLRRGTLEVVEGADHGFKVLKRIGTTPDEVLDLLAERTVDWIRNP